jgi:hypothetical protein
MRWGVATNSIISIPNFIKIALKVELGKDTDPCTHTKKSGGKKM